MKRPLVTIGIPTFNRSRLLGRALSSAMAQSWENLEILVSDNGSTDATDSVVKGFQLNDSRIRYNKMQSNRGPAANYSWLRDHASGEFFMWLADDDWIDSRFVELCAIALESDPTVVLSAGRVTYCDGSVESHEGRRIRLTQEDSFSRIVSYYSSVGDNGAFYGLYRRTSMPSLPKQQFLGSDWTFVARVLSHGKLEYRSDARLYRDYSPVTDYHVRHARGVGLSSLHEATPGLVLAVAAAVDVIAEAQEYSDLRIDRRVELAVGISRALIGRLNVSPQTVVRKAAALVRAARHRRS